MHWERMGQQKRIPTKSAYEIHLQKNNYMRDIMT